MRLIVNDPEMLTRQVADAKAASAIDFVLAEYQDGSLLDDLDCKSLTFADWCFNLLKSNTESLAHLNVETIGSVESIRHSLMRFMKRF